MRMELVDARRAGSSLEPAVHTPRGGDAATIKSMEMSHADRGCMRQEDCFAVPPEPGSQLMVRPAFKPRPGQGRQQPTTGDGSRQRDSRQARIPSAGLGLEWEWCAGPRRHVVLVWCRLGNNDIVALCFDGGTRVATPPPPGAGVMVFA